jgi:drug/metabolite transporter superfamily protein YnfA
MIRSSGVIIIILLSCYFPLKLHKHAQFCIYHAQTFRRLAKIVIVVCLSIHWFFEGTAPDRFDIIGAAIALVGSLFCPFLGTVLILNQNIVLLLALFSGILCSTSQCSTILPLSSNRKISIPAQLLSSPGHS